MDEEKKVSGGNEGRNNDRMEDLRSMLASSEVESNEDPFLSGVRLESDDVTQPKRSNVSLFFFLAGIVVILGVLGYVAVDGKVRARVISFLKGELGKAEKARADDLVKLYTDKMDQIAPKYGSVRLQYFPQDAKVHIIRRYMRYDDVSDTKEPKQWGEPAEIHNASLELKEGEKLPYLSIENLPVRDRGLLCPLDGKFYPPGQGFCPGKEFEKCKESEIVEQDDAQAAAADDAAKDQTTKKMELSEECAKGVLKPAQYCPVDQKYYIETSNVVMLCPDGETPMDPGAVPIFTVQYDFLFEAKGWLPKVVSYSEQNWEHLSSGQYFVRWPNDFALLRSWGAAKEKFANVFRKIKCWEQEWSNSWEEIKRSQAVKRYAEIAAEEDKKAADLIAPVAAIRAKYADAVAIVDAVSRVKGMATTYRGLSEIYVYCSELGKCDPAKMAELAKYMGSTNPDLSDLTPIARAIYWGTMEAMGVKKWDGMEEYYASRPAERAGMLCIGKWMLTQKEGQFSPVTDKDCLAAIESVKAANEMVYDAYRVMFVDQNAGQARLAAFKNDIDQYLLSEAEYKGEETYANLVFRVESTGKFVEYVVMNHLFAPENVDKLLAKMTESRQANYRADCLKRKVVPTEYRGIKQAVEVAWGTGSEIVYGKWFDRLWGVDVQGCLMFAKDHGDTVRYERYLKIYLDAMIRDQNITRDSMRFQREALVSIEKFRSLREQLKAANALYKSDRKAFEAQYPASAMENIKATDPDFHLGLLLIAQPADGKAAIDAMMKLETRPDGTVVGKDGDQPNFHKVLFYREIFAPAEFQQGMAMLKARVEPYFLTRDQFNALLETQPDLPTHYDAMREIRMGLLHMKYFWLIKLYESPSVFESELARIQNSQQVMDVARFFDPQRFIYLADLVWMKDVIETYDRYDAIVPAMTEALNTGYPVYLYQKAKLESWCKNRSRVLKGGYKMAALGDSYLREPEMIDVALTKVLRGQNRVGQLYQALADFGAAVQADAMGRAMDDIRDAVIAGEESSKSEHAYPNLQDIIITGEFAKDEFDSLKQELEKTAAHADWYGTLVDEMRNKRWNCSQVDFKKPAGWDEYVKSEKGISGEEPKEEPKKEEKAEGK